MVIILHPETHLDYPWLSRDWIRGDVTMATQFLPALEHAHKYPALKLHITEERKAQCHRVYNDREIFFNALDKLPKTIQHLDAMSRNLFLINDDGTSKTVAIDWAFVGRDAIGAELVSLFWVTLNFADLDASEVAEFEQDVFTGYLDGLKDAGWKVDPNQVRLGFTSALALRHFGTMMYMLALFKDDDIFAAFVDDIGLTIEEISEHWLTVGKYIDGLTNEARQLINAG